MSIIHEPVRHRDGGFFGPDSVSWRISGPTIVPAMVYTGVMFFLSPQNAAIGMQNTGGLNDPIKRVVETAEYMYAMYFGDRETATKAAAIVNSMHDHVNGTWAPTGDRIHRASDPTNLLWLLVPYGQAVLAAYDAYGPRRLTADERDRYWRDESSVVAELNRIPLDMHPASQAEADEYMESQRPLLATTAKMTGLIDNLFPSLLRGSGIIPAPAAVPTRLLLASGVAILPDYAMELMGQRPYPRAVKAAIIAANRPLFSALMLTPYLRDFPALAVNGHCRDLVLGGRSAASSGSYADDDLAARSPVAA